MQFEIMTMGKIVATGETDNPYQIRNFILQRCTPPFIFPDEFSLQSKDGYLVKANASLQAILAPLSKIINEQPPLHPIPIVIRPVIIGPKFSLKDICGEHNVRPIVARRRLRKVYGIRNIKYEWPEHERSAILAIITGGQS